ncbi:MAG: hypothetical protein MR949_07180 [Veillonellaceae bacterium]|nr:hypothetical protein [Veillonellaceae bacterium]
MANHMAEVAKLLGVKLGEVFFIREYPSDSKMYLKFTENGLERSLDKDSWAKAAGWVWELIITGALKINKLPWRPSRDDAYYMPSIISIGKYIKLFWTGSKNDEDSYQQGLVFRTEKEAVELAKEMLDVARKRFAGGTKQEENNG